MNYFCGSLYGDKKAFDRIKEELNLTKYDTLWLLGDIIDGGEDAHETCQLLAEIMSSVNVKIVLGDHEFYHIMRYFSRNDKRTSDAYTNLLINDNVSGEEMINYIDNALDEESQDELLSALAQYEINYFIKIGENYFYITHGFPQDAMTNDIKFQQKTVSGEIRPNYYSAIRSDKSLREYSFRRDNTFVICAHQDIFTLTDESCGIYYNKGVFLLAPSIPNSGITILGIDAGGFFTKEIEY